MADKAKKKKKKKSSVKLSTRIMIGFFAAVLIPVISIALIVFVPMSSRLRTYGREYGVENLSYTSMYNNSVMISNLTKDEFENLRSLCLAQPEILENTEALKGLNARLSGTQSSLVIRKENSLVFNGSGIEDATLLAELPLYGSELALSSEWINIRPDLHMLIKQADFTDKDQKAVSAFILTNLNQILPGMMSWLRDLLVICIAALAVSALLMSIWIYAGVVSPVRQLKNAARNIRDGNLDFSVAPDGKGIKEIDDVVEDFEEMRTRLKESQEEKDRYDVDNRELISNISHDLKTPITSIKGYCEGIMDGVADTPEKKERYIRTIYNKANDMDRLINELTYYSRIDSNKMMYSFTKININEYFNDCADELSDELATEHIQLTYENTLQKQETIIGDAEQLKRVIHNIVSNSVKYMDKPEKKIAIRLFDAGDFVQADFEDNGKGISKQDLPKIFDRFYRTDASRNSVRGGSGIGLSIVKKIMDDHGGSVWATSTLGEGTTMHFILRKYSEVPVE